ncbi:MAG: hypothetical protein ACLQVA_01325 [Candidatus Brocadiia bacterium]
MSQIPRDSDHRRRREGGAAEQGHEDIAETLRKYLAEHPAQKKQRPALDKSEILWYKSADGFRVSQDDGGREVNAQETA